MYRVYLGLGSNLGERERYLEQAVERLSGILSAISRSPLYESEALLKPGAPEEWNLPFLNMAVAGDTELPPLELLDHTQRIENSLGRARTHDVWSPRTIDIDLLHIEGVTLQHPRLTLPHPEMHRRAFVLLPLRDIAPGLVFPSPDRTEGESLQRLIQQLPADSTTLEITG